MALVSLTMKQGTLKKRYTYTYSGSTINPSPSSANISTVVTPCTTFDGNIPYKSSATIFYHVINPSAGSTVFQSVENFDEWSKTISGVTENSYSNIDISSPRDGKDEYVHQFPYVGATYKYKTFTTVSGVIGNRYKMECWGADGGIPNPQHNNGVGIGGYTYGEIIISSNTSFYCFVGGQGEGSDTRANAGGYNGGGGAYYGSSSPTGGGGATDFRLNNGGGNWNDIPSLKTRIMVAGGGGGTGNYSYTRETSGYYDYYWIYGGCGGGLWGGNGGRKQYDGTIDNPEGLGESYNEETGEWYPNTTGGGGRQDGHGAYRESSWNGYTLVPAGFGYAPYYDVAPSKGGYAGGGGSGWYGGNRGFGHGGGGGSSFISGHPGCNAVESTSGNTITHKGVSTTMTISGREYKFTYTQMIDGKGRSWTTEDQTYGNTPEIGRPTNPGSRNGYARITYYK